MDTPVRFGPERIVLAVVLVLAAGTLPLALSSTFLTPLLLVPVLAAVWVLRARVVASRGGFEVCNGLRARHFSWDDVGTFVIPPRGPVRMKPTSGGSVMLTALPKLDLNRFLEVGTP